MSRSQRLTQAEIRRAFHLLGEVCELGESPMAWRGHLLTGLCTLVGATRGFCDEEHVAPQREQSAMLGMVTHGLDPWAMRLFGVYIDEGSFHIHPLFPKIQPIATRPWTHVRRELFPDDGLWYTHRVVNDFKRPCDMDDCLHSRQPIPRRGWSHMLAVFRGWHDPAFSVRERRLVHLVHEELRLLWFRPPPPDPADDLPPRLSQLARRLRAGDSEKQAAISIGISRQTLHDHAKALHRRFGVTNRYDLLARLAPPRRQLRPRLSYEVNASAEQCDAIPAG